MYLQGADLLGADLQGANLQRADLQDANLRGARMEDGVIWETYLADIVPARLTAGGRPLAEVATPEVWGCHNWDNCPVAVAFGVNALSGVPPLFQWHAKRFVQFFDAGLIPCPTVTP